MIVAQDVNGGIGYKNKLLCNLKDDMQNFVKTTKNKTVLMGYNTFLSLNEKPLKDRVNFVCVPNPDECNNIIYKDLLSKEKNLFFNTPEYFNKLMEEEPDKEFIVIGGAQIYNLYLPKATRVYLTIIFHEFENVDTYFPDLKTDEWRILEEKTYPKNEGNDFRFSIFTLERV